MMGQGIRWVVRSWDFLEPELLLAHALLQPQALRREMLDGTCTLSIKHALKSHGVTSQKHIHFLPHLLEYMLQK